MRVVVVESGNLYLFDFLFVCPHSLSPKCYLVRSPKRFHRKQETVPLDYTPNAKPPQVKLEAVRALSNMAQDDGTTFGLLQGFPGSRNPEIPKRSRRS